LYEQYKPNYLKNSLAGKNNIVLRCNNIVGLSIFIDSTSRGSPFKNRAGFLVRSAMMKALRRGKVPDRLTGTLLLKVSRYLKSY